MFIPTRIVKYSAGGWLGRARFIRGMLPLPVGKRLLKQTQSLGAIAISCRFWQNPDLSNLRNPTQFAAPAHSGRKA
jgi:hypothetical protein